MCDTIQSSIFIKLPQTPYISESHTSFRKLCRRDENVAVFHRYLGHSYLYSCAHDIFHRIAAQRLREFIEHIIRPTDDVIVMFSLHDFAGHTHKTPMVVAATRDSRIRNEIALPTFQFNMLGWESVLKKNTITPNKFIPPSWIKRRSQLVWRGTTTGLNQHVWRTKILKLSKDYPNLIDAKCSSVNGSYMSLVQQQQYKYNLYTPGFLDAYSWRLPSLLLGGFVVLIPIDITYTPWFMKSLQPWTHYVPVDEGTITDTIKWLQTHDDKAWNIANAARRIGQEIVSPACVRQVWMPFLNASRIKMQPKIKCHTNECKLSSW